MIESLENRLLFKGGVVSWHARTLTISGTARNDVITLSGGSTNLTVTLNGKSTTISKVIRNVVVYAGGGDDYVDAGANNSDPARTPVDLPVLIDGGTGNDTLYSGDAGDTLLGANGNDHLEGMVNHDAGDYHDGGPGDDELAFGGTMYGGSGTDVATADNLSLPLVGGLEKLETISDGWGTPDRPAVVERDHYRGDLATRRGKLVFTYPTANEWVTSLDTPTLRKDGSYVFVFHARYKAGYKPTAATMTATFDLNKAVAGGIVVTYDDPSGAFSSGTQTVLIPAR